MISRRHFLTSMAAAPLAGCGPRQRDPVFERVIGSQGHTAGRFYKPRGIEIHERDQQLYVVDWDGRIQRFNLEDGAFRASWIMPKVDNGKPEDLCLTPDHHLLVADTHYHRVVEFDLDGKVVHTFGSYGREPGQFIYPVGICCSADGEIYVTEYGENDRVQRFDRTGQLLGEWGYFGVPPHGFQRPGGIAFTPDQQSLWVADTVNHRVRAYTRDGEWLRDLGSEGADAGQLRYPHDVDVDDEAVYVLEFGNQRISRFPLDGTAPTTFGTGGRSDGHFGSPWRFALYEGTFYISDTGNHRVVTLPVERAFPPA